MNSLGIYFGVKDINLVEASGKKIINNIRFPHPGITEAELEEKVPADIKIIAMLKDAFRSHNIKAEEVFFCVSGQDMVSRTFEIPLLPQSELKSAINFEVKKYIPFKLDELDYDSQVLFNKKDKTSLVFFVGIKKEILANYISIAKQLNLKLGILEYSAFSVLRFLKLAGLSDTGVVGVLCFDSNNEDEANFMVFENGFPVFTRDFVFIAEPGGFEQTVEADSVAKREKLKSEIRISLDYYKRKFSGKIIRNIFIISDKESQPELNAFFTESSIPVKFVETQKILGKGAVYSSILAKSFAAALFKSVPLKVRINLIGERFKAGKGAAEGFKFLALLEGVRIDFTFILLGALICAAAFGIGLMRAKPIQEELDGLKNKRIEVSSVSATDDFETLSATKSKYRKKISALDNLAKNQVYATYPLDAIPRALPKGVWLDDLRFSQKKDGAEGLFLDGGVYLANSEDELKAVNAFLANLKSDPIFSKYFKNIIINSIDRKLIEEKSITVFSISCQNSAESK